jgi:DNA-binding CsgD family transcriptional regulator
MNLIADRPILAADPVYNKRGAAIGYRLHLRNGCGCRRGSGEQLDQGELHGQGDHDDQELLDEGPELQRLLEALPTDAALGSYVERLLEEAGAKLPPPSVLRVRQPLAEPLTDRELTVLRYLCSRLSNQEIASAMYVSLNTLKSHIKSIYRKLDATTRAEAAAGARNLGLV